MDSSLWSHLFSTTTAATAVDPSCCPGHQRDGDDDQSALRPPPGFVSLSSTGNTLVDDETRLPYTQNLALTIKKQNTNMGTHNDNTASTAAVLEAPVVDSDSTNSAPEPSIPRRNLTEAFEELYVETPAAAAAALADESNTPAGVKHDVTESSNSSKTSIVSPTGVSELPLPSSPGKSSPDARSLPKFSLHPILQRDLSPPLVNRVSLHSIIHDINKEAASMAANDDSSFSQSSTTDDEKAVTDAIIDEEKWLLSVIEARDSPEVHTVSACPPTFLQAMGEKEYDSSLSTASQEMNRTTLWKPSRSWWEAKSGKNPWIEPTSHNKRWRYLWPLIHYHKLLTKCIKKLKRNGLDVKTSVSPVAVFLREEVCAVSDHLAAVSLYDSDEWMECLVFFRGWTDTDPKAEARLRTIISNLELRPLSEPKDIDSALLRNQIDEKFLRAMEAAREQAEKYRQNGEGGNGIATAKYIGRPPRHIEKSSRRKSSALTNASKGKTASQHASVNSSLKPPSMSSDSSSKYPGYNHHGGQWWGGGWPQYAYCDENSVHSALTYDSHLKPQHPPKQGEYGMYPPHPGAHYYPPPMTQQQYEYYYGAAAHAASYPSHYYPADPAFVDSGWVGHPQMNPEMAAAAYGAQQPAAAPPGTPSCPSSPYQIANPYAQTPQGTVGSGSEGDQTPYNYDPNGPMSPFWGHIDAAIMQGIMTPAKVSPRTPPRAKPCSRSDADGGEEKDSAGEFAKNAKPLLINGSHYYHHNYGYGEGHTVPPSPATQFMMSPSHPRSAAYYSQGTQPAYTSSYTFSPRRPGSQTKKPHPSTVAEASDASEQDTAPKTDAEENTCVTPPQAVRKLTPTVDSVDTSAT